MMLGSQAPTRLRQMRRRGADSGVAALARVLAAVLAGACGDGAVAPAPEPPVPGLYVLRTVADSALPYALFIGSGTVDVIQADTLTLYPGGLLTHVQQIETRATGYRSAWKSRCRGLWQPPRGQTLPVSTTRWSVLTRERGGAALRSRSVIARDRSA